jgi:hypothetical protein
MPESDVLLTIAEVAVAFAGFASLVGVLGQRSSADDPRVIGVRMRAMLLASLMVVGFSIFPILLAAYGADPDLTWMVSSLVLLVVTVGYYRWFVRALQALGDVPASKFQRRLVVPIIAGVMFTLGALLLANVFFASPAVYLTALALLLFQSGFAFSLIVFSFLRGVDVTESGPGSS